MSRNRDDFDPELETRVRAAFGRADPPPAPARLLSSAADLADRADGRPRGRWSTRLPFAFAVVAVVVTVGLVGAVLSQGRHSTTQGEELLSPATSESAPPPATSSPTPSTSVAPSSEPSGIAVASIAPGRYRSTTPLQGNWCLDIEVGRDRYVVEEPTEVSTWPPEVDGTCGPPPDPDAPFVPYRGWNRGTIGPLEDGTPAIFVQLVVDLQSPFQEFDLALEQTNGELVGTAASFGGETVPFTRVGPAVAPTPEASATGYEQTHELMPPIDVPPAASDRLPIAGWDVPGEMGCNGDRFPIGGIRTESGAELRTGPEFEALREAIEWSRDPAMLGTWREAGRTPDWVIFVTDVGHELWYVTVTRRDGTWAYAGLGDCMQVAWPPPQYGVGYWQLDPAYPAPDESTTLLHLLVTEERCAGGRSAAGRISPAYVFGHDAEVTVQVFVQDPGRGQDCRKPASPTPVTVELPMQLGDRALRDANVVCRFCSG